MLERKIISINAFITDLQEEIAELCCIISEGAFLEREILVGIFMHAISQGTSHWALSHVNRWWRHVTFSSGPLWSKIRLSRWASNAYLTGYVVCHSMEQFEQVVNHSQHEKLDLDLSLFKSDKSQSKRHSADAVSVEWVTRIVTFLNGARVFRRARSLCIRQSCAKAFNKASFDGIDFPELERLSIYGSCPTMQSRIAITAGKLKIISIDRKLTSSDASNDDDENYQSLEWVTPLLTTLATFRFASLNAGFDDYFEGNFHLFSHLRILVLTGVYIKSEEATTIVDFVHLKTLTIKQTTIVWSLRLPNLNHLTSKSSILALEMTNRSTSPS
ncbi:hypothetical protein SIIN_4343_T [Serendipita indica DSM 11827]|nr:hypothetical protein SIIN_4343_T [Serendipita indica DSM 11827]